MNWLKQKLRAWLEVPPPVYLNDYQLATALTDRNNALRAVSDLDQKFDALTEALGIYVVIDDQGCAVVATEAAMLEKQVKNNVDALLCLQELRKMVMQARDSVDTIHELTKQYRNIAKRRNP